MGNIESVIACSDSSELHRAEQRLQEIDKARSDFISLIAAGTMDEDSLDAEFQKLFEEEQELNRKIKMIKEKIKHNDKKRQSISEIDSFLDNNSCKLTEYDDIIVRKLIECVKVISKTEISVVFKGGYEMNVGLEK